MAGLIEVTFENIDNKNGNAIFTELIGSFENIISKQYQSENENYSIDWSNPTSISNSLSSMREGALFIKLSKAKFGSLSINRTDIQFYCYSGSLDLNILFNEDCLQLNQSIVELHEWSCCFAKKLNSISFYCGIEPASDHSTRYFTDEKFGPLYIQENV